MLKNIGEIISSLSKKEKTTEDFLSKKVNITDKAISKRERDSYYQNVKPIWKLIRAVETAVGKLFNDQARLINIGLALGICTIIISTLHKTNNDEAARALGIGITCVSFYLLKNKDEKQ